MAKGKEQSILEVKSNSGYIIFCVWNDRIGWRKDGKLRIIETDSELIEGVRAMVKDWQILHKKDK